MEKQKCEINDRNKKLGQNMQMYRKNAHVTQEQMSEFCGVSKNHLSKIEQGVYKCPANVFIDYGKHLNVSLNILAGFEPAKNIQNQPTTNIIPELQSKIARLSKKEQRTLLVVLNAIENSEKAYEELPLK